jgi:hypothetical protein
LLNQGLELAKSKLNDNNSNPNIPNSLRKVLLENVILLRKLIINYKLNLNIDRKDSLINKIFLFVDEEFLISIILGRVLGVVSNHNQLIDLTNLTAFATGLGKDVIKQILFKYYERDQIFHNSSTDSKTYSIWKQLNNKLVESTEDEVLVFEVGVNFMDLLELTKSSIKIMVTTEKKRINILVPGSKIEKIISNSESLRPILKAPEKIPMIVLPDLYEITGNNYQKYGGYLLNGVKYFEEIILSNWELKVNSSLSSNNKITEMVNNINSVAFRINQNVLDFIITHNNKYHCFIEPNQIHILASKTDFTQNEKIELESFYSKKW